MSHVLTPYRPSGEPVPEAAALRQQLRDSLPEVRLNLISEELLAGEHSLSPEHTATLLTFDGGAAGQTRAVYHRPRGAAPGRSDRLYVVMPIFGKSTLPQDWLVEGILASPAAAESHVLAVAGEEVLFDWPVIERVETVAQLEGELARSSRQVLEVVAEIRALLDWMETRGEVDVRRSALAGFSISAITGSLALAAEDRFRAGALLMVGGRVPRILRSCASEPGRARRALRRRFGWTLDELEEAVSEALGPMEPLTYAPAVGPERVLMAGSTLDDCIPPSTQDELWQALGRPRRISMTYGHKIAFLAMGPLGFGYLTDETLEFFEARLGRAAIP